MTVELIINGEQISATESSVSLFDYAEKLNLRVPNSCRKQGKCCECLVEVEAGSECLSERTEEEQHLSDKFRLSCRTRIVAEEGRVVCHTLRRGKMKIEEDGSVLGQATELDPAVTRVDGKVSIEGREVGECRGSLHGLAIDLGTTTVVVRLFDLESGKMVTASSFENPQRFGGSDVMSRIQYDRDNKGHLLQRVFTGYLNRCIEAFPVDRDTIYEVVVVGNTTMRDLFFGLDVYGIGRKPYRSLTEYAYLKGESETTAIEQVASRLKLSVNPHARVYGLPLVSGHVGADAAACLLAIGMEDEERLIALMDIGTNTELLFGNRNKLFAASCPGGPAFEGGKIHNGMSGLEGAIERVKITDEGELKLRVIGDSTPQGICGSAMIDILGELLRTGKMNYLGRFEDEMSVFTLDQANDIHFYESDINEIAQAKGANAAGLKIVSDAYGSALNELDAFYIAGGFGRHIDIDAAQSIGLIPALSGDKVVQLGNAAIEGASIALLSLSKRKQLEAMVRNIKHVELETDSNFLDHFTDGCMFEPIVTA